jgi:OmcA/MtrC family decaheme c-type cytochrome
MNTHTSFKRAATLVFAGMLALAGCQDEKTDGASCTVTSNGNGTSTISCTDGTSVTVANGTDGAACTVKDNGNGTKTISCTDGTSVTVSDGSAEGPFKIAELHGEKALQAEGEFAACAAGVTTNCGKYFVDVAIASATVSSGIVTVNFTVKDKKNVAVTDVASVSANVAKLVKMDGLGVPAADGAFTNWVPYLYSKQTVAAAGEWPAPAGTFSWQPSTESSGTGSSNGTLTNSGNGSYTYTFKKSLTSATYDGTTIAYEASLTHRVSIMIGGHAGPTGNAVFDFVPAGGAVADRRDIVQTDACKSCHGWEFHGHGGNRMLVENCVTCHLASTTIGGAPGSVDPHSGEELDAKVMIHKIHAGGELASIAGADGIVWDDPTTTGDESADNGQYAIWGYREAKHEWWKAEFPAIIENCTKCHQGTGAQVDNWKTKPSKKACGSCHDTVNFATGTNHTGGPQTDDATCAMCHPAEGAKETWNAPVTWAHDWTTKDARNIPEYIAELTVSTPANGKYFVAGEALVVTIKLKDAEASGTPYINHTTFVEDPNAAVGCQEASCPVDKDGKFKSASLFVHGPRAKRMPVLTTNARAAVLSGGTGPFDLSASGATLVLKVDQGQDIVAYDSTGGDFKMLGKITVAVPATGAFANKAAATTDEIVAWLNGNTAFKQRAIAYNQGGKVGIRSRKLGRVHAIQLDTSAVTTAVFGGDVSVHMPTGSTVSNNVSQRTVPANNDPKVQWFTDRIEYTLDPVDDLDPGTYVANIEFADRGRVDASNYKTPTVAKARFQVKQEAEEKAPAGNCASCHQGPDGKGFVLDYSRHNKIFDDTAVDQCGACHDYQPQNSTGSGWTGSKPISKRVHAVHNGSELNYPLLTVDYQNGDPVKGRNWFIEFPQSIRNCETCHPAGTTSGSWATKPARLPCMGCHDSDAATAHIKQQTYDPTPADPWSGDEEESCKTCH